MLMTTETKNFPRSVKMGKRPEWKSWVRPDSNWGSSPHSLAPRVTSSNVSRDAVVRATS